METVTKKKIALRIVLAVIVLAVVGLGVRIYYAGSLSNCDKAEPLSAVSPDKKWTVVQVFAMCGDAGVASVYSQAELRSADGDSTVVFDMEGSYLQFKWLDAKHLQITFPKSADVLKQKESHDDITISYVIDQRD